MAKTTTELDPKTQQLVNIGTHIEALQRLINKPDNEGSLCIDENDVLAIKIVLQQLDRLWLEFVKEEGAQ